FTRDGSTYFLRIKSSVSFTAARRVRSYAVLSVFVPATACAAPRPFQRPPVPKWSARFAAKANTPRTNTVRIARSMSRIRNDEYRPGAGRLHALLFGADSTYLSGRAGCRFGRSCAPLGVFDLDRGRLVIFFNGVPNERTEGLVPLNVAEEHFYV